ncbi:MAG: DUF535 domain-containing protein [Selenomonadaceae bacterium]|nr:DUF535 domain-containing protein [Selenomonadaceae bacterium]
MIWAVIGLGKQMYDVKNWREAHRLAVYIGRCFLHSEDMTELYAWFQADATRREILANNPFPMEQVTRAFFYAGSTFAERRQIVQYHLAYEQNMMLPEWFLRLHTDHNLTIWEVPEANPSWCAKLHMAPGQRKEGMLSVNMIWEDVTLYQVIFWLNENQLGESSLWIGALQGSNVANAQEIIKEATKRAFRYRTKNLAIYLTQAVARELNVKHIYAVSNVGYYAQNHVRADRKLKTNLGAFWEEIGGRLTADPRFYELPLTEKRKTMEEVPTRKRAVYRKRFAFQDDVDAQVAANMGKIMRQ